jgi:hypothetical protein
LLRKWYQNPFEEIRDSMEMERKRIYCSRRSAVSESDSGIESLSLERMSGSPKLTKMVTGNYRFGCEGCVLIRLAM